MSGVHGHGLRAVHPGVDDLLALVADIQAAPLGQRDELADVLVMSGLQRSGDQGRLAGADRRLEGVARGGLQAVELIGLLQRVVHHGLRCPLVHRPIRYRHVVLTVPMSGAQPPLQAPGDDLTWVSRNTMGFPSLAATCGHGENSPCPTRRSFPCVGRSTVRRRDRCTGLG
ncbi:hypothetical protein ACFFX0_22235 [Citricoccus parietis]|uniref:Uncharacterized protein n=1 Tax=Citricoccus parietis TaxID=592307 RepID=A0ABV5G4B4_9MICC